MTTNDKIKELGGKPESHEMKINTMKNTKKRKEEGKE